MTRIRIMTQTGINPGVWKTRAILTGDGTVILVSGATAGWEPVERYLRSESIVPETGDRLVSWEDGEAFVRALPAFLTLPSLMAVNSP